LEKAGYKDAQNAANEAEKEAEYEMMAQEGEEGGIDEEKVADRQLRKAEGDNADDLERGAYQDAAMAAKEAEREAEYELMRKELEEGFTGDPQQETRAADKTLRQVEIEEVEDEEA